MKYDDRITWTNCRLTLGELQRWERNPATIGKAEARRLVESFDEFGQVQTLAVDSENRLVDGHQRLDTWIAKFGPDCVVDCRRASRMLTDKEREKLAVYLRSATVGAYDWDELSGWDADDLNAWGMDQSTLDAWNSNAAALRAFLGSEMIFGDTATDRQNQGVSSTWDQVKNSEFVSVKIGQIEARIDRDLYDRLYHYLENKFNLDKLPVFVSFSELLNGALLDS